MPHAHPCPLPNSRTEPDGSAVIRVLSYNIRSMRDDTDALARVITACAPDLVLIQEAPRFFRWRKKLARLADASGLVILSGGATAAGPALLCSLRATVERTEDVLLPLTPGLHRRGFATAVVRFGGARLGVLSCHLSLQKDERHEQARHAPRPARRAWAWSTRSRAATSTSAPAAAPSAGSADGLQDCWTAAPWGGEYTFTPTRPAPAHRRDLRHRGHRGAGLRGPRGLPGVTEADLRAATDHLPVLAALRVPARSLQPAAGQA